jgi:hypothetical protein
VSSVTIVVTPPGGSPLDITNDVLFRTATFEQQMNAVPGTFSIVVRDPDQVYDFDTGWEIALTIDGLTMFGGYVTVVGLTHMAPAADTTPIVDYELRTWSLRGVDYNVIFDRRVWRNTADYLHYIDVTAFETDGEILTELIDSYADMSDFTTTGIENVATIDGGDIVEQGQKIRKEFESLSMFGGTVWYIDGEKNIVYKPYDDVEKRWGFSDDPNLTPITVSPAEYQGATYKFREVEGSEDGSFIVNDALIWGGSEFAGAGGTVFAREENATSQTTFGRWQVAETHFGERFYRSQAGVDARANVIVNGPPGADATGLLKGLRFPQWQFTFKWFSDDVPELSGSPDHIVPGDIVTIVLETFGVTQLLPLRTLRTTFPDAILEGDPDDRKVQFSGTFGLQLSDPFTLWRYLMQAQNRVRLQTPVIVTESSTTTQYGASFSGSPDPTPDGVETVFTIPFGYIAGTLDVWVSGLSQTPGVDFTETDNEAGEFTMSEAPIAEDVLWVTCNTLDS